MYPDSSLGEERGAGRVDLYRDSHYQHGYRQNDYADERQQDIYRTFNDFLVHQDLSFTGGGPRAVPQCRATDFAAALPHHIYTEYMIQ